MKTKHCWVSWLSLGLAATFGVVGEAHAKTIVVTTAADSGWGSLRDAIQAANSRPTPDTIVFDIPGGGVHSISPLTPLPALGGSVTLDGWAKDGAQVIELDGSALGSAGIGLDLVGTGNVVRHLTINRFGDSGLRLAGNGRHRVERCFVGTDATGYLEQGNWVGIWIASANNHLLENLISANEWMGVYVGAGANRIERNTIGPDANGENFAASGVTSQSFGVQLWSDDNLVLDNLIAGDVFGITFSFASHNVVRGNTIGSSRDGAQRLGDLSAGMLLELQSNQNVLGGVRPGEANRIAFVGWGGGGSGGVRVLSGDGNTIRGNEIHSIDDPLLAIDLPPPTIWWQWPVFDEAWSDGNQLVSASGVAFGQPGEPVDVDFYSTTRIPQSGRCDASAYLGSVTVVVGSGGYAYAQLRKSPTPLQPGEFVGITSTSQWTGETTEFSECEEVQPVPQEGS